MDFSISTVLKRNIKEITHNFSTTQSYSSSIATSHSVSFAMASNDAQSETNELLRTLAQVASSTTSIDESVRRMASALESLQSSASKNVTLTYAEKHQFKKKDEDIAFMKDYIKMKHSYDAMIEVCLIHIPPYKCPCITLTNNCHSRQTPSKKTTVLRK